MTSRDNRTRLRYAAGALALPVLAATACTSWFDSPETSASKLASERLNAAVQEQAETLAREGGGRLGEAAAAAGQRVIAFARPDGSAAVSERGWPVLRVTRVAAQHPPQLLLEGPVRGVVFLDEREIGLVQDGSVRIVTLAVGEHQIRIEHPLAPPMQAQFYIDAGERISLRWESRGTQ